MRAPSLCESRPRFEAGGLREGGKQRQEKRRRFSKKPGSFKPGGQQTPPPHAAARSIAERSGCELAPRGAAWSRGGGGRGGLGSPARRIGPGKQHPFPLLLVQFNSHSAPATPCCHRPLGQLSAWQPGLGRGREERRCHGGGRGGAWGGGGLRGRGKPQRPTAFAAAPRPLTPTTQRASPGAQPMGPKPGKKGARVRMRLRKGMLPMRGQQAVHPTHRAVGGPCASSPASLASLER